MIVALISLCSAVALVALWRDRPDGGRRWTGDSYATAAVALMIAGGLVYDSTEYGGSRTLQLATLIAIVAATGCYLATAGRERLFAAPTLAFVPMLMALYMFVLGAAGASDVATFNRLAPVVLWACMGALLSSSGVSVPTVSRLVVGVTCSIALLLPITADAITPCTTFKCGPFGELLKGPMPSGNYLGQLAAISLLICVFRMQGPLRVAVGAVMLLVLVATDSRTSQIAVAMGLLVGLLIKFRPGGDRRRPVSYQTMALLAWPTVVVGTALGIYLVYAFDDGDFSNRANTWARGITVLDNRWPIGLGGQAWSDYQDLGALPKLFPHSEYLLLLFWGGMFAVLGYSVLLALVACRSTRASALVPLCCSLVMFLLTLGLTEAFWNPTAVDGHSFFIVLLLAFAYAPADPANPPPDAEPAPAAAGTAPRTAAGTVPARTVSGSTRHGRHA